MTPAEKAAAAAARMAAALSVTAASLTEEVLTALLKARQDAAAAAAAKEAADAEAARAVAEAAEAAVPTGGARAAIGATSPAATTEAPAVGDSEVSEDRIAEKLLLRIKESGLLPAAPGKPASEGGPEKLAAESGPEPLQPAASEEGKVIKLYKGALAPETSTAPSASLLEQARRDLATADREAVAYRCRPSAGCGSR